MKQSRQFVVAMVIAVILGQSAAFAVDGKKAEYIGGTISGMPENVEGTLDTKSDTAITFTPDKKGVGAVTIPYAKITGIEYGQKAGRRVAVAVLVSPVALFSKKRKHFMTLSFSDSAGKEQAAVLELGKDIVRTTLTIVETRSGKKIEYQDEEARKAGRGGD